MVSTPNLKSRLLLDVIAQWKTSPINYDEYLNTVKATYKVLLTAYASTYGIRLRLGISRRPAIFDPKSVKCSLIEYAQSKFCEAVHSLAVGGGDVRNRLRSAYIIIHVIRPKDLPSPLNAHMAWILNQLTWRPRRYQWEGALDATTAQMKRKTGSCIAERIFDMADALNKIFENYCKK